MTERRLRPLGLGDLFDEAFDLYKQNWALLALTTAVAAVPLKIVVGIVTLRFLQDFLGIAGAVESSTPDMAHLTSWLGGVTTSAAMLAPLYLLGYGLEMTALARATSARYLGQPITVWRAYQPSLRRFVPLLLTSLLFGLACLLGLSVCGIPVLIPLTLLLFTAHAFALENKGYGKALGRSSGLVSGYGGRIFGALLALLLISAVLSLGMQMPLQYGLDKLLRVLPGTDAWLGSGGTGSLHGLSPRAQAVSEVSAGLAQLLVTPFLVSVLTVLYYDLRIRKEAFDVELLAQDLGYPTIFETPVPLNAPTAPPIALAGPSAGGAA